MASAPWSIFESCKSIVSTRSIRVAVTKRACLHPSESETDAEELRTHILAAASSAEARPGVANPYGQRYTVDFDLVRHGRTIRIRSSWIVRIGEDLPWLTSCYVL